MRRLAAALALALLAPIPALASGGSTWFGECTFDSVAQETITGGQDRFVGYTLGAVALYSSTYGNVVNATVTCEVRVNGVTQSSASQWGTGLVILAGPIAVVIGDSDDVTFCTTVDFTSDDTPTQTVCEGPTQTQFPNQKWIELVTRVFDFAGDVLDGDGLPDGASYNTGHAGFVAATEDGVVTGCAFVLDRVSGTTLVLGTATSGADDTRVRCRLTDTSTGAVVYDETATHILVDAIPATTGPLTICAEGSNTTTAVGPYCRPGEPLHRTLS